MKPRFLSCLALSLLILLAAVPAGSEDVRAAVGHRPPDFTLRDVGGRPVQLSKVLADKAVLLNFWATWCPPCQEEMPTMELAYREYKGRGQEILAVSIDVGDGAKVATRVKAFMTALGLTFPALLDHRHEVVQTYRLRGLPTTFLVDHQGLIRFVEIGFRDWTSPEAREKIESVLR